MCEHKDIAFTNIFYYHLEKGYDKTMEKKDVDMIEYETGVESFIRCQNCGEVLGKSLI